MGGKERVWGGKERVGNNEDESGIPQHPLPTLHSSDHAPVRPLNYLMVHQNHPKSLAGNAHSLVSPQLQVPIWSEPGTSKKHAFLKNPTGNSNQWVP